MAKARFQVYRDVAGKFRFRLRAQNSKIVAVGEAYETKAGCVNGVHAIKKYCDAGIEDLTKGEAEVANPKFQVYVDEAKKHRFRLRAPNNEIVAIGEGYESKAGCMKGVRAIKEYCDAGIEDLTTGEGRPSAEAPEEVTFEDATTLLLDKPPSEVQKGSSVSFTGKLISGNKGIAGAYITICESDRSFMKDDHMGFGETLEDGTFSIDWKAKEMDWWDDTVEVYAVFRGAGAFNPSKSKKYVIKIS